MSRILKDGMEPVHGRNIIMRNYQQGDSHIICHGRLEDRRTRDNYKFTGETMPAGIYHEMEIVLLVKVPEMLIEDVEVVLGNLPLEDCRHIVTSLEPIKGELINQGFTKSARKLVGGVTSCTHLVHLLCTMASAVFQGYWASLFQSRPDISSEKWIKTTENLCSMLENSCYAWRLEGKSFQELLTFVGEREREG
jgi:hypothetical protein